VALEVDVLERRAILGVVQRGLQAHVQHAPPHVAGELDVVAGVLGIATSKGALSGAQVGRAYEEGRILEIARYNAADVEVTRQVLEVWEETVGNVFQERQKWQ
jgi:hypothetical protein